MSRIVGRLEMREARCQKQDRLECQGHEVRRQKEKWREVVEGINGKREARS